MTDWPINNAKYEPDASDDVSQAKWQAALDASFASGLLRWERTSDPYTANLVGECPRCGHGLTPIPITLEFIRGFEKTASTVRTNVVCSCSKPHRTRPEKTRGCGWALLLVAELPMPEGAEDD